MHLVSCSALAETPPSNSPAFCLFQGTKSLWTSTRMQIPPFAQKAFLPLEVTVVAMVALLTNNTNVLKPSAKENVKLLLAPRVALIRTAAWNLIVFPGSNFRTSSNKILFVLLKRAGAYLLLQTRLSLAYSMQYIACCDPQWQAVQPCC